MWVKNGSFLNSFQGNFKIQLKYSENYRKNDN